ncbi:MAG: formyltransferase [Betaproteobacteria bacterium]|nr:formyltransferase [Betaproteobacteria bacterium]
MTTAVVFAYHNVGVRCLRVLLAQGVRVPLVVTHQDNPAENIWFRSVAQVAAEEGIPCITPEDPNAPEIVARIAALQPDFLFSFYYRLLLKAPLLAIPRHGALNMHGSLLPKYRGRVPVNWAIIHGETETGATLHYMTEKPDNGDIVAQAAVPILPDDTAGEVFDKVTVAAELALHGVLPTLVAGAAPRIRQDLGRGAYFGGRKPEDGRIDWSQPSACIHNLVRAVAPPYPGAFTDVDGRRLVIQRTRLVDAAAVHAEAPQLRSTAGHLYADCAAGTLEVLACTLDGAPLPPAEFARLFGAAVPLPLMRK